MSNSNLIHEALNAGEGIVRLAPCWVPRSFLMPGGRLKLDPRDLYALGAQRGGIDERWFSSTTNADNGPGAPADEGLSYIDYKGARVLLKDVPPEHHQDLDYILDMLDWEANVDPEFDKHRKVFSKPVKPEAEMRAGGYSEMWITYGTAFYSAKKLTVLPGRAVTIRDAAAGQGVVVKNSSDKENLVILKHFGPGNPDAVKFLN